MARRKAKRAAAPQEQAELLLDRGYTEAQVRDFVPGLTDDDLARIKDKSRAPSRRGQR